MTVTIRETVVIVSGSTINHDFFYEQMIIKSSSVHCNIFNVQYNYIDSVIIYFIHQFCCFSLGKLYKTRLSGLRNQVE